MAVPAVGRSQVPPQFQPAASATPPVAPGIGGTPSSLAPAVALPAGRSLFSRAMSGLGTLLSYIPGSGLVKRFFTLLKSLFSGNQPQVAAVQTAPAKNIFKSAEKDVIKVKILAQLTAAEKANFESLEVKDQSEIMKEALKSYEVFYNLPANGPSVTDKSRVGLGKGVEYLRQDIAAKVNRRAKEAEWAEGAQALEEERKKIDKEAVERSAKILSDVQDFAAKMKEQGENETQKLRTSLGVPTSSS